MIRNSIRSIAHAVVVGTAFFCLAAHADVNDSGVKTKWSYIGNTAPERWGRLSPSFATCSSGKVQSPINIPKKVRTVPTALMLRYTATTANIINDGTTDLLIKSTHTIIDDGHGIQVNYHDREYPENVTFNNKDYRLVQFHLHTPGETEWHNQTFPLEIHFVHQNDDGGALVIGVFVKGGEPKKTLQQMIEQLPQDKGIEHPLKGQINPTDLVPTKLDYYSFMGSLTTPPCSEGLQWVVLANPITASPAQIAQLRKANGGVNARPVQPLNNRVVNFSEAAK
jgi:carbonic anhydrase